MEEMITKRTLYCTVYTMNEKSKKRQQANLETTKAREVIGYGKNVS
jgi:hypothetical protein